MKEKAIEVLKSKEGVQIIHQQFSSLCFNKTWEFLEKKELSDEDIESMIAASYASLWHWKQRSDSKSENFSIAYWQLGRVHCIAKKLETAEGFGQRCLEISQKEKLSPFYIGYAYEVLLNAAILKKNSSAASNFLQLAHEQLELVGNKENKGYLKADLDKLAALL